MFIHDKLDEINKADDKAKYSRLIEQGWGEQVFANSNLINAAQNGAKEILQDMVSRHSYSDETKMAAMDAAIEHKQVDTVIVMGNAGNGPVQALYEWSKNAEDRPLLDRLINEGNYEPTGSAKQFLTEHCAHDTSYIFEAYDRKNRATQEKYLQPGTVEVLKKAKLDQVEHQSFSLERTNKPRQSQKRNQGLSLS